MVKLENEQILKFTLNGDSVNVATKDYEKLINKPQVNNIELQGNKTLHDLGIQAEGNYANEEDLQDIEDRVENLERTIVDGYTKAEVDELLDDKVDKVTGKDLSTNDFTNEYKTQIDTNTTDIDNIKIEQTTQNTNIQANAQNITNLQNTKANKNEIPDVSEFITNAVDDLVNYYKKNETYTQEEVNQMISAIPKFKIQVVQQLPTEDISTTTLYLLPNSEHESGNVYTEYIYVNNAWEKLGTQRIDLSDYYTKTETNNKFVEKETGKGLISDTEKAQIAINEQNISDLSNNKVDKITGKGLSTNDFTNAYKQQIDTNTTDIATLNTNKADKTELPTKTSDLTNDSGFIDKTVNDLDNYTLSSSLATVATSGSYRDLSNKPTIPDELSDLTEDTTHRTVTDTEKTAWNSKSDFSGSYNDLTNKPDLSGFITKNVNDLTYYTLATDTGTSIELSINSSTYVVTLNLKNAEGTVISTDTIDLPLETMVVNATYDKATKEIVLTLQSGATVRFSVADLVSGLQAEITAINKLASDLVDDTNQTNKFVTSAEKTAWNNKENSSNKVTSISASSTNTQYPSAKAVYDYIASLDAEEVAY